MNMKKLTIIAAMLLSAGVAHAAGEGTVDVSGVQGVLLASVTALLGFVSAVGLAKAGLGAAIWGWRKIQGLAGSK
ncbi:hypothetical protein CKOHBEJN_02293 [Aeromonas hydrophila]|uniref:hypothetical protein n=1 Tax=Aeromonas hydrophila TaxID=644 RepID=UPI00366EE472